jgi:hypothetical protein
MAWSLLYQPINIRFYFTALEHKKWELIRTEADRSRIYIIIRAVDNINMVSAKTDQLNQEGIV